MIVSHHRKVCSLVIRERWAKRTPRSKWCADAVHRGARRLSTESRDPAGDSRRDLVELVPVDLSSTETKYPCAAH